MKIRCIKIKLRIKADLYYHKLAFAQEVTRYGNFMDAPPDCNATSAILGGEAHAGAKPRW